MKNRRNHWIERGVLALCLTLAVSSAFAQKSKYACDEPDPQSLCTAGNTCGSPTAPCQVDVKRTNYGASATPQIPGGKDNQLFCVRPGTTVNWMSSSKNVGFSVDVSDASPFTPGGVIRGGSDKDVPVVAKTSGCYKYWVGACISGALNGMCKNSSAEVIVTK